MLRYRRRASGAEDLQRAGPMSYSHGGHAFDLDIGLPAWGAPARRLVEGGPRDYKKNLDSGQPAIKLQRVSKLLTSADTGISSAYAKRATLCKPMFRSPLSTELT